MAGQGTIKTTWKRKSRFEWIWLWRSVRVLAWMALLGGLVAAWRYGVPQLVDYTRNKQDSEHVTIHFINPPAWFQGDLALSISLTLESIASADPFDQDQLRLMTDTLKASGWFQEVRQVRRTEADEIIVDAAFVKPFAMVRSDEGDMLVDPTARRLPMQFPQGEVRNFVVVTGAEFARPPKLGEHWTGSDVAAGLKLVRLIDACPWREQVAEVDVRAYRHDRTIAIVTDQGTVIQFEHAPGEEEPLELPAQQKMQMLSYNFRMHGHIAGADPRDLRFSGGTLYSSAQ